MISLPQEIVDALKDPQTINTLTTTDEDGTPHSAIKQSLTVLDDGQLGYVELIFRSRTYKNILRNHRDKKKVAISIFNPESGLSYQIKGIPTMNVVDGPVWKVFMDECWASLPDAEPAAVWLITPEELMNEAYEVRLEEEKKRMANYRLWNTYARKKK